MFEDRLEKISIEIFEDEDLREYFVLTHKKHRREMYFAVGNKEALFFAEPKFNSLKKGVVFFLLKIGVLQPFLKRVMLSSKFGDVIFLGGQIKSFDLSKKTVNSFFFIQKDKKAFIRDKEIQRKMSKMGFAPRILKIDRKKYFSQEELMSPYIGSTSRIFNRLLDFYGKNGMYFVDCKSLVKEISRNLKKNALNCTLFDETLKVISSVDTFLQTNIHGDFAKEQCVASGNVIYFVDWGLRNGIISEDLVNYFRFDNNYFSREDFCLIIKKYPIHIRENLKEYLLLAELLRVCGWIKIPSSSHKQKLLELSKDRIKNILYNNF